MTMQFDGDRVTFAKAFIQAQGKMEAITKASENPAFKSKYADLSAVLEAIVPALNKAGIAVLQSPAFDGEMVTVTTILIHESGASVTSDLKLRPSKLDPQGIGSATTYGRRYSLLALAGVAPEDDDGNAASGPRQQPVNQTPPKEAPKPPTLAERAGRLSTTLKTVKTQVDLERGWQLAANLRAELDQREPDILADLNMLFAARLGALQDIAA
jgi:hypothetical protein